MSRCSVAGLDGDARLLGEFAIPRIHVCMFVYMSDTHYNIIIDTF